MLGGGKEYFRSVWSIMRIYENPALCQGGTGFFNGKK
jgi:hypothetical protein